MSPLFGLGLTLLVAACGAIVFGPHASVELYSYLGFAQKAAGAMGAITTVVGILALSGVGAAALAWDG